MLPAIAGKFPLWHTQIRAQWILIMDISLEFADYATDWEEEKCHRLRQYKLMQLHFLHALLTTLRSVDGIDKAVSNMIALY